MLDNLFAAISKKVTLTADDKELCEIYFESVTVKKNNIIDEQDKVHKYLYFINEGFMRLFYYDDNGDEVTTFLAAPHSYCASFNALINQQASPENVECVTDCKLLRVSRDNMLTLISKSENFKQYSVTIFEYVMVLTQIRANDLSTLTAELRYKKMMAEQPELLQNVPVQYIASFLGIKPQSLSRIRRQIS
jgi:CRP-like cAMP-binding protein